MIRQQRTREPDLKLVEGHGQPLYGLKVEVVPGGGKMEAAGSVVGASAAEGGNMVPSVDSPHRSGPSSVSWTMRVLGWKQLVQGQHVGSSRSSKCGECLEGQ